MRVVCLAGGVGGAKLADGMQRALAPGELTVIVNTGDDLERHSLTICPDLDTVMYTLAGVAGNEGWGLAGETWHVIGGLSRLGEGTWFRLGDKDIATHLFRTERLRRGERPTDVAAELGRAFGVPSRILPMADEPVRSRVRTGDGWLDFQDYFVRLHQDPEVLEVRFEGADRAGITPEIAAALQTSEAIVVAPSNPVVSIGPILAVPGMLDEISAARRRGVRSIGVSGIVGGKALRGPADRMLTSLGEDATALGVARRYAAAGLIDTFFVDRVDESLTGDIEALGLRVIAADTVMSDVPGRVRLARAVLAAAADPVEAADRAEPA